MEAGWYNDPSDPTRARWHDGNDWTDHSMVKSEWSGPGSPPPPSQGGWTAQDLPGQGARQMAPPPPAPKPKVAAAMAKAQAKAERPWWKKKRIMIPLVLLVLVIGGTAAGGGGDDDKKQVDAASTDSGDTDTDDPMTTTTADPFANETGAQKQARRKAGQYLDGQAFSRTGLIKQLEYEGFSEADATYGTDAQNADWNEQAAKKAAQYLEGQSFSRSGLIAQLKYEGFTPAEAEYGASTTGI